MAQRKGTGAMAEAGPKIRVAIGIFDDIARLTTAAEALIALGIDPRSLCLAADRKIQPDSAALRWANARETSRFAWFQPLDAATDAPDVPWDQRAIDVIAETLEAGAFSSYMARSSDVWGTISTHVSEGALLLAALLQSASLQDQAVRALLLYSPHPVHAEEFSAPARPS